MIAQHGGQDLALLSAEAPTLLRVAGGAEPRVRGRRTAGTPLAVADRAAALLVSRDNAEIVLGRSWRVVTDISRRLGVPLLRVGRVCFIDPGAFIEALQAHGSEPIDPALDEVVEIEELRRRVGKRRRT